MADAWDVSSDEPGASPSVVAALPSGAQQHLGAPACALALAVAGAAAADAPGCPGPGRPRKRRGRPCGTSGPARPVARQPEGGAALAGLLRRHVGDPAQRAITESFVLAAPLKSKLSKNAQKLCPQIQMIGMFRDEGGNVRSGCVLCQILCSVPAASTRAPIP